MNGIPAAVNGRQEAFPVFCRWTASGFDGFEIIKHVFCDKHIFNPHCSNVIISEQPGYVKYLLAPYSDSRKKPYYAAFFGCQGGIMGPKWHFFLAPAVFFLVKLAARQLFTREAYYSKVD